MPSVELIVGTGGLAMVEWDRDDRDREPVPWLEPQRASRPGRSRLA